MYENLLYNIPYLCVVEREAALPIEDIVIQNEWDGSLEQFELLRDMIIVLKKRIDDHSVHGMNVASLGKSKSGYLVNKVHPMGGYFCNEHKFLTRDANYCAKCTREVSSEKE